MPVLCFARFVLRRGLRGADRRRRLKLGNPSICRWAHQTQYIVDEIEQLGPEAIEVVFDRFETCLSSPQYPFAAREVLRQVADAGQAVDGVHGMEQVG